MTAGRLVPAAAFLLACPCAPLEAQGVWDAILSIDPYPSPYYSDWDANPNISSLTVINTTASSARVRIHFNVTDRTNKVVVSGTSDSEPIGAGATVIFDSPYDVAGSTTHDTELEDIAARTGRLPEGDYTACAVAADEVGFVLAESCSTFTIVYPDPPLLFGPMDGEVLDQPDPLFLWTPVQVPFDYQLTYVVRVAEVLSGQSAAEALRSNIPHYQSLDEQVPSLRYPIDARPFEKGKTYAWTVQALDQHGYAASANDGQSEIWSFRYEDGLVSEPPQTGQSISLAIRNGGTAGVTAPPPDEEYTGSLEEICTGWDKPHALRATVDINTTGAFPERVELSDARLVRATQAHGQRVWVIYGGDPGRDVMVLLSGDCGVLNNTTRRRWVGVRSKSDTNELRAWTADEIATEDAIGFPLKFGTRIFSWFEEIAGEDALDPVHEFLEGHEIEIKTGLNLFGVLDGAALGLKPLLDFFGYRDSDIELQGYAGVNTTLTGGVSYGSEKGAEAGAGAEAELLVLRGALPRRQWDGILGIKTSQLNLEVALGAAGELEYDIAKADSGSALEGSKAIKISVKASVIVVTQNDILWTGGVVIPFSFDGDASTDRFEGLALRLNTDWQYPPDFGIAVGHPEFEIVIKPGVVWMKPGVAFTLKGSAIVFDENLGTLGFTAGWHAANDSLVGRSRAQLAAAETLLDYATKAHSDAVAAGDTAAAAAWNEVRKARVLDVGTWKNQVRTDSTTVAAGSSQRARKAEAEEGRYYWKATLALGNMSLLNLLDVIQKTVATLPWGRQP